MKRQFKEIDFDVWRTQFITDEMKAELEKRGNENCYRESHLKKLHKDMTDFYRAEISSANELIEGLSKMVEALEGEKKA